jgi:hypothetical protein
MQALGLLNPVPGLGRFKDARSGLRLELDDVHQVGEEIMPAGLSGTGRATLVATVTDVHSGRPLVAPVPTTLGEDEMTRAVEFPPLPEGCHRLEVMSTGVSAPNAQPVYGLFLVERDETD